MYVPCAKLKKSKGTLFSALRGAWCIMRGAWVRISSKYLVYFILYLSLKNEEVQNIIPISFLFSKGEGHNFTEFACSS